MAVLRMIAGILPGPVFWYRRMAWLIGLTLLCPSANAASVPPAASAEYQLKAVFLFNFAQFVEWPPQSFSEPKAPVIIGILGEDPFGPYLDNLVSGEKIGERPLLVRRYKRIEEITECHIVFICRSEARDLDKIIARLKDRNLLTVSDVDTFTRQGGMVRFAMESGKIRLRINVEATKAAGLRVSSKVLRPGTIVIPGKD